MFSLAKETIFLSLAGSQAHGTARKGSDVDLRGVCIVPLPLRLSLFESFEQYEGFLDDELSSIVLPRLRAHPTASQALHIKTECVIFDISKFLKLCAAANPNALEILFAHEDDWVFETSWWRKLHHERHLFLTKKVQQTFNGYAMAQLKKIKSHRSWLLSPPTQKPSREKFGLPKAEGTLSRDEQNRIEQSIAEKLRSYSIDRIEMPRSSRIALRELMHSFYRDVLFVSDDELETSLPIRAVATRSLNLPDDVVATLNAEKKYRAAMRHWESYQTWKKQRNPARAELESKHGYDTKHAAHLIRLMRMGLEVLEQGELHVRRHDADELSAIRDGALSFDELQEKAAQLREALEQAATTTDLPDDTDRSRVDELAITLMTVK